MRRTLSSSFRVPAHQFVRLLTRMHSTTPGSDSSTPRSTAPLFPVMPIAVRIVPGIDAPVSPKLSMRWAHRAPAPLKQRLHHTSIRSS